MGQRGPTPTPSAILKARGSWRGEANKLEPQPEKITLAKATAGKDCPRWLTKDAKKVWKQLAPQLVLSGVLTRIDAGTLARYCDAFVRWKAAMEFLAKNKEMYPIKDGDGNIKCWMHWPQVSTYRTLSALLLKIEQEFGLTPASRSRIQIAPSEPQRNTKSRFFGNGPKLAAG
jgi:P27 family predicted phage terminase small subunit